jgi:hypothetical protein
VTLPHGRDGLSARRMAVLWTFHEFSLCRHVRRELLRNALLDFIPVMPATARHQRNDFETYRRSSVRASRAIRGMLTQILHKFSIVFMTCLVPRGIVFSTTEAAEITAHCCAVGRCKKRSSWS